MDGDEGIYLPIFTFCLSIIHQVPTITRFHFKKKVWISYNFHLLESWILIEKIIILIKPNSNKIVFFREDSTTAHSHKMETSQMETISYMETF